MPPKRATSSVPSDPPRAVSSQASAHTEAKHAGNLVEHDDRRGVPSPLKRRLLQLTEERKQQKPAQPRNKGVRLTKFLVDTELVAFCIDGTWCSKAQVCGNVANILFTCRGNLSGSYQGRANGSWHYIGPAGMVPQGHRRGAVI